MTARGLRGVLPLAGLAILFACEGRSGARADASVAATAPATAPPGASAPPAAAAPEAARRPAAATGASAAPGSDPAPSAKAAEPLGRIELAMVEGLEDVEGVPPTLPLELTDAPPPGVDASGLPAGEKLYGLASITRAFKLPFAVAADRSALWLDGDADGAIEPDERARPLGPFARHAQFRASGTTRREVDGAVLETRVPVRVSIALDQPRGSNRLDGYRRGTWPTARGPVAIAVVDRTFRGWFRHPGRDAVLVDVDRDGRFDASEDSTERWRLGEPFPLGDVDAVVTAIGPLGEWIDVARAVDPARRISSLAIGAQAPDFHAQDLAGRPVSLAALRGRWVLLDFWATWCGPCRAEMPHLKALRRSHPDVVIVGLSGDRERAALERYVAAEGLDWPQVFQPSEALQAYRVKSFPRSFLVDPEGRIVARDLRGAQVASTVTRLRG